MLAAAQPYPQYFDLDGSPLDGGAIYYGQPDQDPQSAPITVFWDAAGTQPAAQPIATLNGFPVRSGTPAAVYVSGDYSLRTRNRSGSEVLYCASAATASQSLSTQLALADSASSKGAAMVAFSHANTYPVGSSGRAMGWFANIQAAPYDAPTDGSADIGPALRAAILAVAQRGGGRVVVPPTAEHKLLSTVIVPSGIEIDLCNSTIIGPGTGSSIDLFQSGYLSGGAIVTNIGAADESHLVQKACVKNGTIKNAGKAFNLFNWIWNSELSGLIFWDCTQAVYSRRSWYSRYVNLMSLGSASGAAPAAFYFADFVNVQAIESVFVTGRSLGIEIYGGANGLTLFNCSAESCTTGVRISGETGPIKLDTCYIEANTVGVDLDTVDGNKIQVTFDNCWFYSCVTGVKGETSGETLHIKENCRFISCGTNVSASDNINDFSIIEIPPQQIADSGLPSIPSGYLLGKRQRLSHLAYLFDSGTGLPTVASHVYGPTQIPFEHEGYPGAPKAGTVSFCTHASTGGTSFSVNVDSKIGWSPYASLLVYRFSVSDNGGTYEMYGLIFGDQVKALDATSKTVSVSNNGGYVRVTLGTFGSPTGVYSLSGTLRHV